MNNLLQRLDTYAYALAADQRSSTAHIAKMIREARDEIEQLRKLEQAVKFSAGLKCPEPSCGDSGCITGTYYDQRGDPQPEPIQCEFCYTEWHSAFNTRARALQTKGSEQEGSWYDPTDPGPPNPPPETGEICIHPYDGCSCSVCRKARLDAAATEVKEVREARERGELD